MRRAALLVLLSSVGLCTASSPAPSLAQLSFLRGWGGKANGEESTPSDDTPEENANVKESSSEKNTPRTHQHLHVAGGAEQEDLGAAQELGPLDEGAVSPAHPPVPALTHELTVEGDDAAAAAAAAASPELPGTEENQLMLLFQHITQLFLAMRRRLD